MINFNYMGSDYGGWSLSPDLIPESSTIISAGVGEDITFDLHLKEYTFVRYDQDAQ